MGRKPDRHGLSPLTLVTHGSANCENERKHVTNLCGAARLRVGCSGNSEVGHALEFSLSALSWGRMGSTVEPWGYGPFRITSEELPPTGDSLKFAYPSARSASSHETVSTAKSG